MSSIQVILTDNREMDMALLVAVNQNKKMEERS